MGCEPPISGNTGWAPDLLVYYKSHHYHPRNQPVQTWRNLNIKVTRQKFHQESMVLWGEESSQILNLPPSVGLSIGDHATITTAAHGGNRLRTHIHPSNAWEQSPRHYRLLPEDQLANCHCHCTLEVTSWAYSDLKGLIQDYPKTSYPGHS